MKRSSFFLIEIFLVIAIFSISLIPLTLPAFYSYKKCKEDLLLLSREKQINLVIYETLKRDFIPQKKKKDEGIYPVAHKNVFGATTPASLSHYHLSKTTKGGETSSVLYQLAFCFCETGGKCSQDQPIIYLFGKEVT